LIYNLLFVFFVFLMINSSIQSLFYKVVGLYSLLETIVSRPRRRLPITGWRLGAAAAFTHYLSNPHFPPPLRQTAR
jgi:hypothetical protein